MIGMGTLINSIAIVVGGLIGLTLKKLFSESMQDGLKKACGISTMFIAIAGAMEGMLKIKDGALTSEKSLLIVLCMTIGTLIGEAIGIDKAFVDFGNWLKNKTGNKSDTSFVNAFLTASFTVCIGAMAIVGSIEDGIRGNISILVVKSVLDFIMIAVMASSIGKGAIYSAIPVFVFQGLVTLLVRFISPILTEMSINYISLIGSILIFCVGVNLIWDNKIKIANMLPSLVAAVVLAYVNL